MKASHNPNADNSPSKAPAEQAMERGDWANALTEWKSWWAAAGEHANLDPDAMHDRAVCHFHCGDKGVALDWLNRAADVQPEYSYRYSSRGWMKQASGDTHGAIADYKKALELDPEDAVTWNNLGLLEEQLGYQEQARERYRVSDELLGILNEHGIDPESSNPTFKTVRPSLDARTPARACRTGRGVPLVLNEMSDCIDAARPRELWTFIKNGLPEGQMRRSSRPDLPLDGTSFSTKCWKPSLRIRCAKRNAFTAWPWSSRAIGPCRSLKGTNSALTACSPAQVLRLVRLCQRLRPDRGRLLRCSRGSTGLWLPTNPR